MALSPKEFEQKVIGKKFDVDGYYGAQCWDLFGAFCKMEGIPVFNCTSTGYVKDIWNNRYSSGILKYFDIVDGKNYQNGDWVVFPTSYYLTPYSHIGMYWDGKLLGQNQPKPYTTLLAVDWKKSMGGLRFKKYPKPTPTQELKKGDQVQIIGTGNANSNGTGGTAYGIGWKRQILAVYSGRKFPYQVGNSRGTTGFYKRGGLKKL